MVSDYYLLFKTATAEFRAWQNLDQDYKKHITLIVEMTRGRKKPTPKGTPAPSDEEIMNTEGIFNFERVKSDLQSKLSDCKKVILDLTREPDLTCAEINNLSLSKNGYENWVQFVIEQKANIPNIIPTLLINPEKDDTPENYTKNIKQQFKSFASQFNEIAYRISILSDNQFEADLDILETDIKQFCDAENSFIIEIDFEYIRQGMGLLHIAQSIDKIKNLMESFPEAKIVILSTSFPRYIGDIGNPDNDTFSQEEVRLFDELKQAFQKEKFSYDDSNLAYGDYASINPVRNDMIMTGWRPRIDFPTNNSKIFYYREKKGNSYPETYKSVAKKIIADEKFESTLPKSWGVKQISQAGSINEPSPGSSPSFWISVRMEIHIIQQLRRLGLI